MSFVILLRGIFFVKPLVPYLSIKPTRIRSSAGSFLPYFLFFSDIKFSKKITAVSPTLHFVNPDEGLQF